MTKLILTAAAAALALAGCTEAPERSPADAEGVAVNATGNEAAANVQAQVLALSPEQRNVVFIRAIRDSGLPCQGVVSSDRLEDQQGNPTWRAMCDNGTGHLISITPDGTAIVMSRND